MTDRGLNSGMSWNNISKVHYTKTTDGYDLSPLREARRVAPLLCRPNDDAVSYSSPSCVAFHLCEKIRRAKSGSD